MCYTLDMDKQFKDIYWLAGILEGEGTFGNYDSSGPVIQINMTDFDVIKRVHTILKCTSKISVGNYGNKTTYTASLNGNKAIGWMFTLYSIMCERRQEKIKEIILKWKNHNPLVRGYIPKKVHIINGVRTCIIHGPIKFPNTRYRGFDRNPDCKACFKDR